MINEKTFQEMNRAIKTGELIKMLAKEELKSNIIFNDKDLLRATKETNTNTITRNDIEFEKALLTNEEYNILQEKISYYIGIGEHEKLFKIIDLRDNIYNYIRKLFIIIN